MHVIRPVTFSKSHLTSSNAVEAVAAYNTGATYNVGSMVSFDERIYECAANGVVGVAPNTDATKWLVVREINKYLAFDDKVGTATTAVGNLVMQIKPGMIIDSLALFNIKGGSIIVQMLDSANNEVYRKQINLDDTLILSWLDYFISPYDFRRNIIIPDLPPYSNTTLNITLIPSGSDPNTQIGQLTYGSKYKIGMSQYGASSGIKDYSVKETDKYGNTFLKPGAFNDRMEVEVWVEPYNTKFVKNILTDLRGVPCVWFATEASEYENLNVFGYYRDFNVVVPGPSYSVCSLEIEGL